MKRSTCLILVLILCLLLQGCGAVHSTAPTARPQAETDAPTEIPTEPAELMVVVLVPEDWKDVRIWAWKDGGADAYKVWPGMVMTPSGDQFYQVNIPAWTDRVVINANDGTVQTPDLSWGPTELLYIHVVSPDYVFVHEDAQKGMELIEQEKELPALDYHNEVHAFLSAGGYQVTAAKAVTFSEKTQRYCTDHIPDGLLAGRPEEIYYVVHLCNADKVVGTYKNDDNNKVVDAVQPGIRIEIREIGTGRVLAESEPIMGGLPAVLMLTGGTGRGAEPNPEEISGWIETALAELLRNPPAQLPVIP